MSKNVNVYSAPINFNAESLDDEEKKIEMKLEDYNRLIGDLEELKEYFTNVTGQSLEEYKLEQILLKKLYNSPSASPSSK
jgi:hypothetical protein